MTIVAVDTGGTFTDLVASTAQAFIRIKVPSTPASPETAILSALELLHKKHGVRPSKLIHGTTVGTNALLEKKGARVVLITNEGFEDILYLRRQNRPELYALHPEVPSPLVAREFTLGIQGRLGARGIEVEPLANLEQWAQEHTPILEAAEAFAISFLHSYANPAHEKAVASFLRARFPATPITTSSKIVPLSREYERTQTAVANSFITPTIRSYLQRLEKLAPVDEIAIMGSAGGCLTLEKTAKDPILTALSGPAGGLLGARAIGDRAGKTKLLSFDMGGTSTDIAVIDGGVHPEDEGSVGDINLRTPLLKIETIGAGGGSIAAIDDGGLLHVGPESAGATPGPACYGKSNQDTRPTVTDANAVLGRITALLGGDFPLNLDAARKSISPLAQTLNCTTEEAAEAIVGIANASMARACKRASMSRGIDPRTLTLVAFGGAGGLHACEVADEIGCSTVIFPGEPGLLSAEGMLNAPFVAHHMSTLFLEEPDWETHLDSALESHLNQAHQAIAQELPHDGQHEFSTKTYAHVRYSGQSFELAMVLDEIYANEKDESATGPQKSSALLCPTSLRQEFEELHRSRFGYILDGDNSLVLVSLKSFSTLEPWGETSPPPSPDERVNQRWQGPLSIPAYSATLWLPAGWEGTMLSSGDILCSRTGRDKQATVRPNEKSIALGLEIHRQRLAAIAEEMGAALMEASFSANIKQRRDFSCALFDETGNMLAHAAHIPVHLGSQPLSVAAARKAVSMNANDTVILNDPFAGGTHLPDVTLVSPVFLSAQDTAPSLYVSNRAHHADVGGISPGSIPSPIDRDGKFRMLTIADEGIRIPPTLLTDAMRATFSGASRTPLERRGDLRAQEAANHIGSRRALELYSAGSSDHLNGLNNALLDYAEKRMRSLLSTLPDGEFSFSDCIETGDPDSPFVEIPVVIRLRGDSAEVDFTNAPAALPNSLNAVRAITVAAVFYVFQCLGENAVPANSGMLRPITISTKPGTLCDASYPSAVSAGNVETSQRLVDVLFGALAQACPDKVPAASGGSMNNILFGGTYPDKTSFVHYETLACGSGGGPSGKGADAIQIHMTNTLNTPVEAVERDFPVRIVRYALRDKASNDTPGIHPGGRGVCREYQFLQTTEVTIISERRAKQPYGLNGAPAGQLGRNWIKRNNNPPQLLGGKATLLLEANDCLIIETPCGGAYQPPE